MRIAVCVVLVAFWLASMVCAAPAPGKAEDPLAETRRLLATRIDVDLLTGSEAIKWLAER